ncbi:MAG: methyltransferase domain-containing protein [Cyanobacteria bacterium P01_F01_bin.143]
MSVTNSLTYWQKQQANIHGMMLNPEAEELHHHEKKQIISCLPNLADKTVLELGAGIGRFTTDFAGQAKSVTAVDFNQNFIQANKENNTNHSNIIYQCENAINLSFPKETFDFVFVNWLLMYLEDNDASKIIEHIYQWLKPEGQLFLRESCITDSS